MLVHAGSRLLCPLLGACESRLQPLQELIQTGFSKGAFQQALSKRRSFLTTPVPLARLWGPLLPYTPPAHVLASWEPPFWADSASRES